MSPFNLDDYEPVEERLAKFWKDNPMGRVTTELVHVGEDGYIVKASIWRGFDVIPNANLHGVKPEEMPPGGTGYAAERVTERGVNATSALENCETSAIGRALANLGYAPKGKRPSREEMSKSLEPRTVTAAPKDPESAAPAGMGEADGSGGEALGEGGPPSDPPSPKDDLSFHPNSPHRMAEAAEFPGYLMCTKGKCPYWEYVGKGDG